MLWVLAFDYAAPSGFSKASQSAGRRGTAGGCWEDAPQGRDSNARNRQRGSP